MCVVHVYDCKDCGVYGRIKELNRHRDLAVTIFTDFICRVEGCKRKALAWKILDAETFPDCTNVLCKTSTCRLVTVPKSCREKWVLEDSNILPVRVTYEFQEPNLGQVSLFGGDSCVIPEPARFVRVNLKENLKTSHAKLTLEPAERSCLYPYSLSDSDSLLTYTSNCL